MKIISFSFSIILLTASNNIAQPIDTLWTKTISAAPYGYAISNRLVKYSPNEFIAAGHFLDSLYIFKLTSEGEILWEKYFYETGRSLYGAGIDKDEFGNLYVIVWDYNEGAWWKLIKLNGVGDSLWSYTVDDQINNTNRPQSIVIDSNAVYIAAVIGNGPEKYALYKFNLDGNLIFERGYTVGVNYNLPNDIACDSYGNVILAGDGGSFQDGGYILKCNSNGDTLWSKSLNGLRVKAVITDAGDNIIVTGMFNRIFKFDPNGTLLFDKPLGDDNWEGICLVEYDDQNVFVIGAQENGPPPYAFDILLGKYSSISGDSIWTYVYDYPEPVYGATGQDGAVFFDSTIVILSHCFINISGGYWDGIFLIMFSFADIPTSLEIKSSNSDVTNYFLEQNYPNPFNPITRIQYSISSTQNITLKVYDLLGREVSLLVNEEKLSGDYEVEFDGANLPSGIYFYQLKAGSFVETKKLILLK